MRRTTISAAVAALVLLPGLTVAMPPSVTASASAGETCDGRPATIVVPSVPGQEETQPVTGTPGDDVIVGSVAGDTIDGGGGNDTICGLDGNDEIDGGTGDDRLFGGLNAAPSPDDGDDGYFGDNVAPGPGDDYVDLGHDPDGSIGHWDQLSYRDSAGPVTVDLGAGTATGEGADTLAVPTYTGGIEGSAFDDHLIGSSGDDWITASGGNDHVVTLAGDDNVFADYRTETATQPDKPEPGDDIIDTGDGADTVVGGHGADVITTGRGRDHVRVADGAGTTADGGAHADDLWAYGVATLIGGNGPDVFSPQMESPNDITVRGGPGRDVLNPVPDYSIEPHRAVVLIGRPAGTLRIRPPGTTRWQTVLRFSSTPVVRPFVFPTSRVTWYGTSGPDFLDMEHQDGLVRAFGRGGADRIEGGDSRDHLDGGPGRDVLIGNKGRDRCLHGEKVDTCELPR